MSYGLEFYGTNNQLIFDTLNFNGKSTLVVENGHPLSNWTNNSSIYVPSDAFLFARVNSGNLRMTYDAAATLPASHAQAGKTEATNKSLQNVEYMFVRQSEAAPVISGGGGYGLEIYESGTSTSKKVTFSTKRTNSVIRVLECYDHASLTDGDYIYTGNPSNIFISFTFSFYTVSFEVNSFQYINSGSNQGIKYKGYLNLSGFVGGGSGPVNNKGNLLVVEVEA